VVTVVDVSLPVAGQDHPVRAWLVTADRPGDGGRSQAGVLWLHWLGHVHSDRGQFLPLAVELASRGVVSLLPGGRFPWGPDPDGTASDVRRVRDQVAAHRAALDHLAGQPGLDPGRIAVVGHDYGGMYGALLAETDERVSVLALQAVDSAWESWFTSFWLGLDDERRDAYAALFADLEPIDAVARLAGRLGDRVLLQWAGRDTFVTPATRAAYEQAGPMARSLGYDTADHGLNDAAAADLRQFLTERLGLDQN
jgi:pimeloyl-ACP methyl ester carboxylesterase